MRLNNYLPCVCDFHVTRRRPYLLFFATGWVADLKKKYVFNRSQKGLKMSGAMSELSYQSIRTANQAREAVNIHHTGKKLTVE